MKLCLQPVMHLNLLCFSDVSVELPFTLMHPKPLEESIYKDGEQQQLQTVSARGVMDGLWYESPMEPHSPSLRKDSPPSGS